VKDHGEIADAFQKAMRAFGYEIPGEKIHPLMGYKKNQAIRMMLDKHEPDETKVSTDRVNSIHDRFIQEMIRYYSTTSELQPLPNTEAVFSYCRNNGIKVGLDTGFPHDITDVIMDRLGWVREGKVNYVVSSDEVPAGRPEPYMIQKMMKAADIDDSGKVIKLGDTEVDVNEGKNAGCLFSIGITTGAFTREALKPFEPSFIIDDLSELIDIIELLKRKAHSALNPYH
jgi:phosphonatase-like hydrolase